MGIWTPGPGPTDGNDVFTGDDSNEFANGGDGDDVLNGGGGNDYLQGYSGDDTLNGGDGNDELSDEADGHVGINGGAGDDIIRLTLPIHAGASGTIDGGSGVDFLHAGGHLGSLQISNVEVLVTASIIGTADQLGSFALIGGGGSVTIQLSSAGAVNLSSQLEDRYVLFHGTSGNDGLISGAGPDRVYMGAGADTANGGAGNDEIYGEDGADWLIGGAGNDYLDGGGGADTLVGEAGDDYIHDPGGGAFTIDGGDGDDIIELGVVNGASGVINGGFGEDILGVSGDISTLAIFNVEHLYTLGAVTGTAEQFQSFGTIRNNQAGAAAVLVLTHGGSANLSGQTGGGPLEVTGSSDSDTIVSASGDDILFGLAGDDVLLGGGGDDWIIGGEGNDWMVGGDGDDVLYAGQAGTDVLIGGDGFDYAYFSWMNAGIYLDVSAGVYANSGVWTAFQEIEAYQGSTFADTMLGSDGGEALIGVDGNDVIIGRGGDDTLIGGGGNDWLDGGDGDDILEGGAGVNILIGGAGLDLASYASATTGLWIDLSAGVYAGDGVWDVFFQSIEGAIGGSGNDYMIAAAGGSTLMGGDGLDTLIGGVGDDHILGGDGGDWIVAGAGNDRLDGGAGVDVYTSGTGADIFDLGSAAGWDVAFDFDPVNDRFDLDGNLWLGLVQADWDGDGQNDDTMLGYAGGNFVALDVSGLTLEQWNALVVA